MAHVAPPLERAGTTSPSASTTACASSAAAAGLDVRGRRAVFPFGLLALLHKDRERITIDVAETDRGTTLVASGVAPLPVRRAFAELED